MLRRELSPPPNSAATVAHLLLIFPGPIHDLSEELGQRLELLSERHSGVVLVSGPGDREARFGRFDVVMLRDGGRAKVRHLIRLLVTARSIVRGQQGGGKRFDAIVTYDPLKSGLIGHGVARATKAPLIVEVNGDYTAAANYADIRNPVLRWLKRRLFIATERFVLRRANGIKLLFPEQIDVFRPALRRPTIRSFSNYVDLTAFRDLGETQEVLFVGYPYFLKGVDLLIQAFKVVSEDHPEWRLKILGWFPDQTELRRAIAGHAQIAVHAPVLRREMPEHMGRCGIFVLPSRTEAMGRVLLEAMACHKPRIGSAVGGIPAVIHDGEDGLLFRSGDVGDLALALSRLMGDAQLRRRLGESGARRVREEFSTAAYFARVTEFYDGVIASARSTTTIRNANPVSSGPAE